MKWYVCLVFLLLFGCTQVNECSLETIDSFEPHDQTNFLTLIDNQLVYTTVDNQTCTGEYINTVCTSDSKVYINEEVIAEHNKSVNILSHLKNKLVYKIVYQNQSLYIGKDKIAEYPMINTVQDYDGKIAFAASKDWYCQHRFCNGTYILVYDGEEIPIDYTSILLDPADQLAYRAGKGADETYLIYGDNTYGPYKYINWPQGKDGKITYAADDKLYINGELVETKDYDAVHYFTYLNNELAYIASKGDDFYLVTKEGEFGPYEYLLPTVTKQIKDKLAVVERVDGDKYYVIFNNEKLGPYNSQPFLYNFNNELAYVVHNQENYRFLGFTLYYKGCEIDIEHIKDPVYYNGNIAYITEENDKEFVVIQKLHSDYAIA